MSSHPLNIWSWHGRVGRARYLVTGVALLAVKHNIDRFLAAVYGYPWGIFDYWVFENQMGISAKRLSHSFLCFMCLLCLFVATSFLWRRSRSLVEALVV